VKSQKANCLNLTASNSNFLELLRLLTNPQKDRLWLQQLVNILNQILNSRSVLLNTYYDNQIIFSSYDLSVSSEQLMSVLGSKNTAVDEYKPQWVESYYLIPLDLEGVLVVDWDSKDNAYSEHEIYPLVELLSSSLKTRSNLFFNGETVFAQEFFHSIDSAFAGDADLRSKLVEIAREFGASLNSSRCQIKIFSDKSFSTFDSDLSVEYKTNEVMSAISVVPKIEYEWIQKLDSKKDVILQYAENYLQDGIEKLLSVKSILGYPILFRNKVIGVLILHQCDYERCWNVGNIELLRRISIMLGLLIGSEIKNEEDKNKEVIDPNSGLITSDAFLRELSHAQVESHINNTSFSLVLVDIEKLRDINISQGFVAGNLVLSQTGRYLKRIYGESVIIARYNNDEFVILLKNTDQEKTKIEAQRIKDALSNVTVLGIGTIDYNFSFVTFPTHTDSLSELLGLLEQGMILSKSRGKFQISSYDEIKDQPKNNWKQLLTYAIPEIILKKSNLKTGPEILEKINKQISDIDQRYRYSADILDSVQSLALALDAKDSYTEGHSKRVSEYAYLLAREIGLDLQQIEWIRLAAGMHDIGKIGIPESILCKPGKLNREEYDVMKKHPVIGAKILKPLKPLESVAILVLYHHEYWDGSGYPEGLAKQNIPIGSRIVSIVDAYQAMTSNRPYRSSLSFGEAIRRLKDGKEKQWDPELTEMFIDIVSRDV